MQLNATQTQFEQLLSENKNTALSWLESFHQQALDNFCQQGLPHRRVELWKYTSVRALTEQKLEFFPKANSVFDASQLSDFDGYRLLFVDGHLRQADSDWDELNQVVSIKTFEQLDENERAAVLDKLNHEVPKDQHPFTHLNSATFSNGFYISIRQGQTVDKPICCHFYSTRSDVTQVVSPRLFILAEANSHSEFVLEFSSDVDSTSFVNAVTEFQLEQDAKIETTLIQNEGLSVSHIHAMQVIAGKNSEFQANTVSLGGRLVRNDLNVQFADERATCVMNGVYLTESGQHVDNHTFANHTPSFCKSAEFYKGIVSENSRAVFNGKVYVAENSKQTVAEQSNHNLLLASNAEVDSKPELEIYSDDVVCSHGATVGQLADEAIFYMRARGINEAEAKALLMKGFVDELLENISNDKVRSFLSGKAADKFKRMNIR